MKTVNGGVTAALPPSASFTGDFSQVNGDFEAAFPLNIHSHPGSRRVSGEVNGGRYELQHHDGERRHQDRERRHRRAARLRPRRRPLPAPSTAFPRRRAPPAARGGRKAPILAAA